MNHKLPIIVYLFTVLIVTRIPYIRIYFSFCNTLIHEVIGVILAGGFSKKIKLNYDRSRQITNFEHSRFKHTLKSYAGYTAESLASIGLFYFVASNDYHYILYLFIGLMVGAVLLWIRNLIGILWAISFIVLLALPIYFRYDNAIMHISIFLSSFLLIQSIINGIQVCRQSLLDRKNSPRLGILAKVRVIPSMLFGIVLLGQSLYAGYFIVKNILSIH